MAKYDIVALTETWLKEGITNAEVFQMEYEVYRQNRNYKLMGLDRGGEVLMAVRKNLQVTQLSLSGIKDTDCDIGVIIRMPNKNRTLHVFVFYFQPNTSLGSYTRVCDILTIYFSNLSNTDDVLLLGDFNLPTFKTEHILQNQVASNDHKITTMYDFICVNDLTSHNKILNISANTLDLVISNRDTLDVERSDSIIAREDSFHPPLRITMPFGQKHILCVKKKNTLRPILLDSAITKRISKKCTIAQG